MHLHEFDKVMKGELFGTPPSVTLRIHETTYHPTLTVARIVKWCENVHNITFIIKL